MGSRFRGARSISVIIAGRMVQHVAWWNSFSALRLRSLGISCGARRIGEVDLAARGKAVRSIGLPLWPWGVIGLATLPLTAIALLTFLTTFTPTLFGDTAYYATALPALTSDAPLYRPETLGPHSIEPARAGSGDEYWDQAPSAALLAAVLLLPGGEVLWGVGMGAFLIAGLVLVMPRLGRGGLLLFAPVLMLLIPVSSALIWANLNSLVFLCLAVALRFPRHAGIAIGLAAGAKLVPILGIAWLAGKRDWRNVAIAVAVPGVMTLAVLPFIGMESLWHFVSMRFNQTAAPSALRWGLVDAGLPQLAADAMALAVAGMAWRWHSFSLAVVAMLIPIPALYVHYWTLLLVPLLTIWIPWVIRRLDYTPGDRGRTPAVKLSAPDP